MRLEMRQASESYEVKIVWDREMNVREEGMKE